MTYIPYIPFYVIMPKDEWKFIVVAITCYYSLDSMLIVVSII